ncbi:NAD(P)/FAD-dependent oxidoreductase [Croceivirga sp. JEA036]|uniref:NAD(P)/FAD-dependent oxidoreductase n=1 Tax=Croceivirga sp. JEA036 TaxID=2721162 RepID=UPI00143CBA38|nr:FAD-dependent oxidoreductase [Croceivirga sp. JEA036]NJB37003.1 FAD-binding oxidoreductase [Croceivirga sp. JEA036]
MEFSYWEKKQWFTQIDVAIIGSGIVGLSTAIYIKKNHPEYKILILERGVLPQGASTKNAGFACFGSISELLSDLNNHTPEEIYSLVEQRYNGIQQLRGLVGDKTLDFQVHGGHEVFLEKDIHVYEECKEKMGFFNELLHPIFNKDVFRLMPNTYKFASVLSNYITHIEEGQINTGAMLYGLLKKAQSMGIQMVNGIEVLQIEDQTNQVNIETNLNCFTAAKICVTTNGFASQLLKLDVKPARAQVLITQPIHQLPIQGTFHLEQGYYYFRNIDNRILLGGGRNLDIAGETTTAFGETAVIQEQLEQLLKHTILPNKEVIIDHRWSGIMGVGQQKKPIIKVVSPNVYCGVRMGGMGIAIGAAVGKELANLI